MDLFFFSETALKSSVIFYLGATGLYLLYLLRRSSVWGKPATTVAICAVSLHTVGLGLRWVEAGFNHPPFTNLYESLLFFAWAIALFYLVLEWRYKFRAGGAFILPIALGAMGAAVLNPNSSKEIQNLMPALQSHWLHAHVAIAAVAYAAFAGSFGASLMFLIKDKVDRKWLGFCSNLFMVFMLLVSDRFNIILHRFFSLSQVTEKGDVTGVLAPLAVPGKLFLTAAVYFAIGAAVYLFQKEPAGEGEKRDGLLGIPYAPLVTSIGVVLTMAGLGALVHATQVNPALSLFGNPFKIIIICLVIFGGGATVLIDYKLEWVRELLPGPDKLDSMSYVIITIAFPLMTMVLVTGMVWAKYAFGYYWQWDPKETASLITWLIYTVYLHGKVSLNWPRRRVAAISILGFASVVFTYLGVSVMPPGYHSYASF